MDTCFPQGIQGIEVKLYASARIYSVDCAFEMSSGVAVWHNSISAQVFGDTKYLEEAKKCGEAIWSRVTAYRIVLLLPPNVAEHRSLLVVYCSFIIVYRAICPSGPPWNEGHRPNGSSRDQCL